MKTLFRKKRLQRYLQKVLDSQKTFTFFNQAGLYSAMMPAFSSSLSTLPMRMCCMHTCSFPF
ncbi:hypothetical protein [Bacteroides luti]|uniref:hypothetical protein n=1 Tax=Bacteroides luti TaxID=1297750 RepID=UPI001114ED9E|nr:hypothetical protein [Bacteroides luti]